MKRIAINGFGRIGRLVFREMFDNGEFEVVAINDLTSPKMLAHLLKYDSVQKKYDHKTESDESSIIVDDKKITIYQKERAHRERKIQKKYSIQRFLRKIKFIQKKLDSYILL